VHHKFTNKKSKTIKKNLLCNTSMWGKNVVGVQKASKCPRIEYLSSRERTETKIKNCRQNWDPHDGNSEEVTII